MVRLYDLFHGAFNPLLPEVLNAEQAFFEKLQSLHATTNTSPRSKPTRPKPTIRKTPRASSGSTRYDCTWRRRCRGRNKTLQKKNTLTDGQREATTRILFDGAHLQFLWRPLNLVLNSRFPPDRCA